MKCNYHLRAAIPAAFLFAIMHGCISDTDPQEGVNPVAGSAVEFPTTISKTRVFDDKWEWGDDIGVFMIPAADPPETDWSTIELHASNNRYTHDMKEDDDPDSQVVFTGFDDTHTILWPGDDRKFDVVAYYPWTASIGSGHLYPVTLADQSSQKAIDLMWSNNVRGRSSGAPALGFVHKLAKLIFNVTDTTGASLDGMTATFDGLPVTASFNLATGAIVDETESAAQPFAGNLHSTDDGDDNGTAERAIIEAIVLPGSRPAGYAVTFTLADGEQALFTVATPVYEAGNRYVYNIELTPPAREGASFGVDGDLKQITPWNEDGEGDEGTYPGEIPKTDPAAGGAPSPAWKTAPGEQFLPGGTWISGRYKVVGTTAITKPDCKGIVSVMVNLNSAGGSTVSSVTVGDTRLAIDHDGDESTPPIESYTLPGIPDPTDLIFRTADGKPHSGEVTILIEAGGVSTFVYGFGTNTDIPENNP